MRELKRISIRDLRTDADQPRKLFPEAEIIALSNSLKQHGQLVPIITFDNLILDGERRYRAAQLIHGIDALDAVVLSTRPTAMELRVVQMSIDAHRKNLSAMERSDFLARIKQENDWSVQELADRLSMNQSLVTKLLKLQQGCDELKKAVSAGHLDIDKAYTISQEPDHAKQRELLEEAGGLSREQLRLKARSGGQPVDMKTSIARFCMPKGFLVTVQGPKMTINEALETLQLAVRELKKAQAERLDVTTAIRVLRDRAKSAT